MYLQKKSLLVVSIGLTFEGLPNQNNNNNSITFTSQGISYIELDPLTDFKGKNEFISIFIKYKKFIKKKRKHYAMEFDSKYKKNEHKNYKIVNKINDLFFKVKYEPKLHQQRRPFMSVKSFSTKKGEKRRKRRKRNIIILIK